MAIRKQGKSRMIKTAFVAAITALFTFTAPANAQFTFTPKENADIGLYLGSQIWQSGPSGIFGEENTLVDFNLTREQQINYLIDVKHPYYVFPNARISTTSLSSTGQTTLSQKFNFNDKTFQIGQAVNAYLNLSYIDYTLYYELFDDKHASVELGFSARDLNGDFTVTGDKYVCQVPDPAPDDPCIDQGGNSSFASGKIKTDGIHPMLYVASNIRLPLTQLSVFSQADLLLLDNQTLSDYQIGLSYDFMKNELIDLNLNLGYRVVRVELADLNSLYTDLLFKGAFVGMIVHF